ncbi:hypothetical protein [Rummeliibacillus pycnus]|uniref:hypothetical protein n=1 Tax=Rummeliibacillus pycnus TaxID=101070 RepID=UPI003D2E726C
MDRHRKMDKHFSIKVNSKSVKILKYKRDSYYDDLNNEEVHIIELITKIPTNVLDHKEVIIDIEGEIIKAKWVSHFSQPGLHRYKYRVYNALFHFRMLNDLQ